MKVTDCLPVALKIVSGLSQAQPSGNATVDNAAPLSAFKAQSAGKVLSSTVKRTVLRANL